METSTVQSIFTDMATTVSGDLIPIAVAGAGVLVIFLGIRYGKAIFKSIAK